MKLIDIAGQKFGNLLVINRDFTTGNKNVMWKCVCDCGNTTVVDSQNLRSGHTKTCGHCEKFIPIGDETVKCVLPNGRYFLFDSEDLDLVKTHKWSVADSGYVETTGYRQGESERMRLHRIILQPSADSFVDHINGHRWDNRKRNLRIATPAQNAQNHKLSQANTSGYKGVSFEKRRHKYEAYIHVNNKKRHLGYFTDPKTAARAYDRAAVFYYGEFANPNFKEAAYG